MPRKNARPAARKRQNKLKAKAVKNARPRRVAMIAHHAPGHQDAALFALAMLRTIAIR